MSFGIKQRIHMGCGEPLQCRSWIVRPRRALPPGDTGANKETVQEPRTTMRSGTKCKT